MLRFRTRCRLLTTLLAIVSLLAAQTALASYVCPGNMQAEAMAAMAAQGQPCSGMDEQQPVLCQQHAASPSQHVEAAKLLTPAPPLVVQVLLLPAFDAALAPRPMPPSADVAVRPPPDPVFLATRRLRV